MSSKPLSQAVIAEIERLGGIAAPNSTLREIVWPEGVTYRTTADHKDDRDVWWARFVSSARTSGPSRQGLPPLDPEDFVTFGTSHGGKVLVCISESDARPADPVVWLFDREKNPAPIATHRLSIFFASLEREPTRKKR